MKACLSMNQQFCSRERSTTSNVHNEKSTQTSNNNLQKLPISNFVLHMLQQEDVFCKNILNQIKKGI